MRPESRLGSALAAPAGSVWVPSALLARARERREQQCRAEQRARQRAMQLAAFAEDMVIQVLEDLSEGRLLCSDPLAAPCLLESAAALERPTRRNPGHLTVAVDYRPTAAGRLQSRVARWAAEDPQLLGKLQEKIEAGLAAAGYVSFFQTHLVQRFVSSKDRGYHRTVRVQLLVGLLRREARRLPPLPLG